MEAAVSNHHTQAVKLHFWALWMLLFATLPQSVLAQIGYMNMPRVAHTGTLLPDGRVLIAGGLYARYFPLGTQKAELFDPSTGTFSYTGDMVGWHAGHTATLLPNGQVLIVGAEPSYPAVPSAELYDPTTGRFAAAGTMVARRGVHTATLLQDGRVLLVGGTPCDPPGCNEPPAEIYDPSTGGFTPTGRTMLSRDNLRAVLLLDGRVLIVGGSSQTAELYDPRSGTFSLSGSLIAARGYGITATLLPNGKVLIAGGYNCAGGSCTGTTSTELYDPAEGTFSPGGNMHIARTTPTATLLNNGKVLVLGGDPNIAWYKPFSGSELYDARTDTSTSLSDFRTLTGNTATNLVDGRVLITGGYDGWGPSRVASLYSPNHAPRANAGADQMVECGSVNGALVTLDGTGSSDPDGDPITYLWKNGSGQIIGTAPIVNNVAVPLGSSTFTLTVTDSHGDSASDSVSITVRDTTAPTLSVALDPNILWPPNHKLGNVAASLLFNDTCDANPQVVLLSLTSSEPDNGLGDGDTADDIQGAALNTDDRAFQLRAERSSKGTGRVYTATYRIRDASGNTRNASGTATVPLTNSQKP